MPFKSDAQRKFFNANRKKIGAKVVDEFNEASKGMKLPKKKGRTSSEDKQFVSRMKGMR